MKKIFSLATVLSLTLLLTACPGDARDEPLQEPVPGTPGTPVVVDPTAGPVDLATQYLVRLNPIQGTAPTGTIAFSPAGDVTRVDVRIENSPTQGLHQGAIHSGDRCDDVGASVADLPPIAVGADGSGEGSGTVDRPMREVMGGGTMAVYHAPEAAQGAAVVCGGIPLLPPGLP
jgi:hypothetical protein